MRTKYHLLCLSECFICQSYWSTRVGRGYDPTKLLQALNEPDEIPELVIQIN